MKAFLIDPATRTITAVDRTAQPEAVVDHYCALLGCRTLTAAHFSDDHLVYVDDEALLGQPPQHYFVVRGYPQPLAGRGLLVGTGPGGEDADPVVTLDDVRFATMFIERKGPDAWTIRPAAHDWENTLPLNHLMGAVSSFLPVNRIGDRLYFRDGRLREFRAVDDPFTVITFEQRAEFEAQAQRATKRRRRERERA